MQKSKADSPLPVPEDDAEFELTMEEPVDPMEMAEDMHFELDGEDNLVESEDWNGMRFVGTPVAVGTKRFKLIRVGFCESLIKVIEMIELFGYEAAGGQWREVFKKTFPHDDYNGEIGFADPSWENAAFTIFFPILTGLDGNWRTDFCFANRNEQYDNDWRWLVICK